MDTPRGLWEELPTSPKAKGWEYTRQKTQVITLLFVGAPDRMEAALWSEWRGLRATEQASPSLTWNVISGPLRFKIPEFFLCLT